MININKIPDVHITRMTDSEYFKGLEIHYFYYDTPIGMILVSSTNKGICSIEFADDMNFAYLSLKSRFSEAVIMEKEENIHKSVFLAFGMQNSFISGLSCIQFAQHEIKSIFLHLRGTDFQLEVWKALLNIPFGELVTYNDIAKLVGKPGACRAVGTAIGKNPVSFVIPCHRVIRKDGNIGGYYWGTEKKKKILEWEKSEMLRL